MIFSFGDLRAFSDSIACDIDHMTTEDTHKVSAVIYKSLLTILPNELNQGERDENHDR